MWKNNSVSVKENPESITLNQMEQAIFWNRRNIKKFVQIEMAAMLNVVVK